MEDDSPLKKIVIFSFQPLVFESYTFPETNMSPLKIGAPWKRRFRTWKPAFSGALAVSFREGINKAGKYHPLLTEDMKVGTP